MICYDEFQGQRFKCLGHVEKHNWCVMQSQHVGAHVVNVCQCDRLDTKAESQG